MTAMRWVLSISAGAALVAAIGLGIPLGLSSSTEVATDPIVSSGIPQRSAARHTRLTDVAALAASPPAVFSLSNFTEKRVCLVERGGRLSAGNRHFFAPPDCEAVWPGLSSATAWVETEAGVVRLLDAEGREVLSLVRGRNFAYQLSAPGGPDLALLMLP